MASIKKGKGMILILISLLILFDIASIVLTSTGYAAMNRSDEASYYLIQGVFRLLLTLLLMVNLYKGKPWAKWITLLLCTITALYGLYMSLSYFNIFGIVMGLIYLASAVLLFFSKDVQHFLKTQNQNSSYIPPSLL